MTRFNNKLSAAIIMVCMGITVILSSCKKEYVQNTNELVAYASPGDLGYNITNGGNITLLRTNVLSAQYKGFTVQLSRPVGNDVQAIAEIDSSLIRLYDSAHNTKSPALPKGAFSLVNDGKVNIRSGELTSTDSVKVQLADPSNIRFGTNTYVIPVVIRSVTGGAQASVSRQIMYVTYAITSIAIGITELSGKNIVDIQVNRTGGAATGTNTVYLKALLNMGAGQPVVANIVTNDALVDSFNKANKTSYLPFPAGGWQLAKADANIPVNTTVSSDSFKVSLPNLSLFNAGTHYLLAIQLTDKGGSTNPPPDATKNQVFVHVIPYVSNIDPTNSNLAGTTSDKTKWSVITSADYTSTYLGVNMLDGNNSTAWVSGTPLPQWFKLDLGATKTMKGFLMSPCYASSTTYNILGMDVESSVDGITWNLVGKYSGTKPATTSSATNPDIKTVKFLTSVTARYFRFTTTSSASATRTGLGEINGVE